MHAVIRRYKVRLGTVAGAAHHAELSLVPQMNRLPGFVAYYLLDAGDSVLASISVCETPEGADAAAALAASWFRSDWPSFKLIPPEIMAEHRAVAASAQDQPVSRTAALVIAIVWTACIGLAGWLCYRAFVS